MFLFILYPENRVDFSVCGIKDTVKVLELVFKDAIVKLTPSKDTEPFLTKYFPISFLKLTSNSKFESRFIFFINLPIPST